jgi:hypothetical protein
VDADCDAVADLCTGDMDAHRASYLDSTTYRNGHTRG